MVENIKLLDNFAKRLADELDITAKDVVELISRHGFSGETFLQLSAGDIEPILDVIGSVASQLPRPEGRSLPLAGWVDQGKP